MRTATAVAIIVIFTAAIAWGAVPPHPAGTPTLTLDLVGIPLADALSTLARAAQANLVVEGATSGTVTLHVAHETFEQALAILAETYRLDIHRVGPTYVVRQLAGDAIRITPQPANSVDLVVRTYHLRYALASDVADELRGILGLAPARSGAQQATTIGQPPQAPSGGGGTGSTGAGTSGATGGATPPSGAPSGGGAYTAPPQPGPAPASPAAPSGPSQGPSGGQAQQAKGVAVASDDRTNSVVVAAPFDIQVQVQDAIAKLDRPGGGPGVVTRIAGDPPGPGAVSGVPVSDRTYRYSVQYADPQAMASAIMSEVPDASVLTDLRTNSLLVTGSAAVQRRVGALLRTLDTPSVQILIQSEILDISKQAASNLGIQWSWQPYTINQTAPGFNIQATGLVPIVATLNALVSNGQGKVLANPQVATQQGVQATINVGQTLYIPITTTTNGVSTTTLTTINAGILLVDTPRLNGASEITNALNVQANSIAGFTPQGYPNISQRSVSSIITVGDGQPILIGGLISDTTTKTIQKIPVLGDIPILGQLFTYTTTNAQYDNIVIVLTPHLIGPRASVPVGSATH
jgi:type II secretory pathway component GspD/PulD (secretin)